MADRRTLRRFRANLQAETDSAFLYRALARRESNPDVSAVYLRMAEEEEEHAALWRRKLSEAGSEAPPPRPGWRSRALAWAAHRFGPEAILSTVVALESKDRLAYGRQPEVRSTALPAQEGAHGRLLQAMLEGGASGAGLAGTSIARLEGRHRSMGGNALRAGVLGANDGLVSNLSLVMGVAGANLSSSTLLVTGFAGLLAGAISMALGEWLSVQSSRELNQRQIALESDELRENPEGEKEELVRIYQAKGASPEEASRLAEKLLTDPAAAIETLAREELGIDPKDLGGSAWEAAATSFVLFALGAILPVIPFLLTSGRGAVAWCLALSAFGLFGIGALITLLTGRGVLFSGFRQMLFGLAAAGVTFGIGRLVGVSIAG